MLQLSVVPAFQNDAHSYQRVGSSLLLLVHVPRCLVPGIAADPHHDSTDLARSCDGQGDPSRKRGDRSNWLPHCCLRDAVAAR